MSGNHLFKEAAAMGFLVIATFAAYYPSLGNCINIWDDPFYLHNNPLIKEWTFQAIVKLFTTPYLANYHPLTLLTYAAEYKMFGLSGKVYHFNNIILHILNTLLVYVFVRKVSVNWTLAFATALLFGIHPLHVESVTWVSERKDVLYTFFYLAGLLAYLRFRETRNISAYLLALALFTASCLSKGMAVTFSVILMLIDYLLDKKIHLKQQLNKIPFLAVSLLFGLLAYIIQRDGGAVGFTNNEVYTHWDRFLFAHYSFFFYLQKTVWPAGLSGLHPYPVKGGGPFPGVYYLAPWVNLLIIGGLAVSLLKKNKHFVFGMMFFIISIFPVLQILSVGAAIASERYVYVASIGLYYLAACGLIKILSLSRQIAPIMIMASLAAAIALSITTFNRTKVWENRAVFWGDVILKYPHLELAYYNRAIYFIGEKEYSPALADLHQAIAINPHYLDALKWRGHILTEMYQHNQALADYRQIIVLDPNNFEAYTKAGELLAKHLSQMDQAYEYLKKAYDLRPDDVPNLGNLGIVLAMKGQVQEAIRYFRRAVELNPHDVNALQNISIALQSIGQHGEANQYLSRLPKHQ